MTRNTNCGGGRKLEQWLGLWNVHTSQWSIVIRNEFRV
jgi:hypothetical protein